MDLLKFDSHDHPESRGQLPQFGCAICGQAVQPALDTDEHWDDLPPEIQREAMAAMAAWQHDHASGHDQQEFDDFERGPASEGPAAPGKS